MESPFEKDVLWTGSDDGLVNVSKDGGKNWQNVTPKDAPKWMMWNSIDADPFKKGAVYVTGTRYKSDDFTPYIYKTEDYGKSWKLITNGIPKTSFTRVTRADQKRAGLLYAGTEYGMYISYNDGTSWKPFQLNLPMVPITDLTIKENDLVVATQGRSFYVIDDLSIVQQMDNAVSNKPLHVFATEPIYRMQGSTSFGTPRNAGINAPVGYVLNFYAKDITDSAKAVVTIMDKSRKVIRTLSTDAKEPANKIDIAKGMNQIVWNLRYPESERIEGMILWNGVPSGIVAPPGSYFASIKIGKDSAEVPFTVKADPNYKLTQADYDQQFVFLKQVQDKFNEIQKAIKDIRSLRSQINDFVSKQGKDVPKEIKASGDSINKKLTSIEETLYQTKAKSGQDVLNYPIRLNDKLGGVFDVANSGNAAPSKQAIDVYNDLAKQVDAELNKLSSIKEKEIPAFNSLIREKALPVIKPANP
jgi:hypothetical protein